GRKSGSIRGSSGPQAVITKAKTIKSRFMRVYPSFLEADAETNKTLRSHSVSSAEIDGRLLISNQMAKQRTTVTLIGKKVYTFRTKWGPYVYSPPQWSALSRLGYRFPFLFAQINDFAACLLKLGCSLIVFNCVSRLCDCVCNAPTAQ